MKKLIWNGPAGHNALVGNVEPGMAFKVPEQISEAVARKVQTLGLADWEQPSSSKKQKIETEEVD